MSRKLSEMLGKTIVTVDGMEAGSDVIRMVADDGTVLQLHHEQDCCEDVQVNDVTGDPLDLVGSPLVMCETGESAEEPDPDPYGSQTWTFYKFATAKGYVTVRWLGESNGYYSESVDMTIDGEWAEAS
jgi:hypothetical protein